MPEIIKKYGGKPFDEAIGFFRKKLNIPTKHWDDLWKDQHAKGFMIAGAMKADLLTDLRTSIDDAIAKGATLADFRKDFDTLVEKHGWVYKGGRNWRTNVIYGTNVRTAYSAGRYQQMTDPDVVALRPFWRYRHGDSIVPRPQHLAWDGLILAHDDPWWDTHYPPNGWGCRCSVFTMSKRDMAEMGKKGPDKAPAVKTRIWEDRSGIKHRVPLGIDPGWDYNPGKAAGRSYKVLTDKFNTLDYPVARAWISSYVQEPAFNMFYDGRLDGEFPVAVLNQEFMDLIGADSQTVFMSRETLSKNKEHHKDLIFSDYQKLPDIIENADVVVQDADKTELFIKNHGKLYHAAVKATETGKSLFLTSFRFTDLKDVARVKRKGKILRDGVL